MLVKCGETQHTFRSTFAHISTVLTRRRSVNMPRTILSLCLSFFQFLFVFYSLAPTRIVTHWLHIRVDKNDSILPAKLTENREHNKRKLWQSCAFCASSVLFFNLRLISGNIPRTHVVMNCVALAEKNLFPLEISNRRKTLFWGFGNFLVDLQNVQVLIEFPSPETFSKWFSLRCIFLKVKQH